MIYFIECDTAGNVCHLMADPYSTIVPLVNRVDWDAAGQNLSSQGFPLIDPIRITPQMYDEIYDKMVENMAAYIYDATTGTVAEKATGAVVIDTTQSLKRSVVRQEPQPAHRLLNSFKHSCFHSHRGNVHKFPDLYRCAKGNAHEALIKSKSSHVANHNSPKVDCPACNDMATAAANGASPCTASINHDLAKQSGLMDAKGNVSCPMCGGPTIFVPGETKAEIHAKLCTDETIHYPEMRKAGKITEAEYQAWKATLTRDELNGQYTRIPDIPIMASFSHEETALIKTDLAAFNALMATRLAERAESALLHQVSYRHQTTFITL